MSMDVQIEIKESYLSATSIGTFSLAEAKRIYVLVLGACLEHKKSRILFDVRQVEAKEPISTMARFEFAQFMAAKHKEFASRGLSGLKLAYVGTDDHIDANRFGENVGKNRGLNMRATTDIEAALQWLEVG
ncbi:MAG TPA: STAS/SEC14 domain-containing protein [Bacteroidota bacterium]